MFEFYWQPPAPVYDPARAQHLLAEAGHPNGFDAGFYNCNSSYANLGEAVVNNLSEVGIRSKLRPIERAAFLKGFCREGVQEPHSGRARRIRQCGDAAGESCGPGRHVRPRQLSGSSTRCSSSRRGSWTTSAARRSCTGCSRCVNERAIYAPIWQLGFLSGVGPRVAEVEFRTHSRVSPTPHHTKSWHLTEPEGFRSRHTMEHPLRPTLPRGSEKIGIAYPALHASIIASRQDGDPWRHFSYAIWTMTWCGC